MTEPIGEHTGEVDCPTCLEYAHNYLNDFIERLTNEQLEGMVSIIVAYTGLIHTANEKEISNNQLLEMIIQMFMALQANPQMQMIRETMIIEGKLPIGEDHSE